MLGSQSPTVSSSSRVSRSPPGLTQQKFWQPGDSEPTTPITADTESVGTGLNDKEEIAFETSYKDHRGDRSIVIRGVPKQMTLQDVCKTIRSGAILDMYRQEYDRTAQVTFLEPPDAGNFMHRVKRTSLYIQAKRVEVSWSDKQYYLKTALAYQIKNQSAT